MRYHKVQAKHKQVSEIVKKETLTLGPDHLGSSAGVWVTMAYCNFSAEVGKDNCDGLEQLASCSAI